MRIHCPKNALPVQAPQKKMFVLDSSSTGVSDIKQEDLREVDILVKSLTRLKNRTQENNSLAIVPYEGPPKEKTPEVKTPPCFLP